jgi:starch-binding outer membrane protein, SusD/RagB family
MKYLRNIILIIFAVGLFYSCEKDFLDTVPNDRLSSSIFWQTDDDAVLATNAIYTYLDNVEEFISWDGMTDIGHITQSWRNQSLIERGHLSASEVVVLDFWEGAYTGIRSANDFMENIDRVETNDQDLIDRLSAEVRVLRAYMYIRLAFLFGDVPLVSSTISLEESRNLTRTPVATVWDFISDELTAAATDLPNTQAETGRITKGAALGIKARAMLYAGRYTEAATAAKAVMDLNVYSLYPSYENLFTYAAENNVEVILDKQYISDLYSHGIFQMITPMSVFPTSGASRYVPTKQMVDAYQMTNGLAIGDAGSGFDPYDPYTNRDPRLGYTCFTPGDILPDGNVYDSRPGSGTADEIGFAETTTGTGFNAKKYLNASDLTQPNNCGINTILMRYAEVLLIYAEAKIESNQIDQTVLDAINEIRSRPDVNMPDITTMVQSELRDIVRQERKVELAFEGLRFFDIRRWRIAENVMPGILWGMTYVDGAGDLQTISDGLFQSNFDPNRDYLWPIPHREIELNANLTQNPNW